MMARRTVSDRREMIRFEPTKEDRREGSGRRKEDHVWDTIQSRF